MVLAQMQDEIAPRYLPIEWSIWVKAVVPIDGESEKVLIEFIRLSDVKDAENRYDPIEAYFHDHTPLATVYFDAECSPFTTEIILPILRRLVRNRH
jgi:hypothetical protein